jgi:hypothetical protein
MAFNECSPVHESLEIDQWPAGVNRSAVRNRNGFPGKELHVSFRICPQSPLPEVSGPGSLLFSEMVGAASSRQDGSTHDRARLCGY